MTKRSAPERHYEVRVALATTIARRCERHSSLWRTPFCQSRMQGLLSRLQPSSVSRRSCERQDLFGNAAFLPEFQQKPLGSHAEQRGRSAMNGKKWATLYSVVTKLPTHIHIVNVCIPNSAGLSSLVVDPYAGLDKVSRVRKNSVKPSSRKTEENGRPFCSMKFNMSKTSSRSKQKGVCVGGNAAISLGSNAQKDRVFSSVFLIGCRV